MKKVPILMCLFAALTAGLLSAAYVALSAGIDFSGRERVLGTAIDVGCFEYDGFYDQEGLAIVWDDGTLSVARAVDASDDVIGFRFDDQQVLFADQVDGYTWTKKVSGDPHAHVLRALRRDGPPPTLFYLARVFDTIRGL